jgi:hypothetical protein
MSIVVYTVILNGWDYLRPPEVIEPGVRYVCFTDRALPPCEPWELQPAYLPFASASRNSRIPKLLPHLHVGAEYSIYHDANFCLKRSPDYLIERYLAPRRLDLAMFVHPARKNVEQEANEIIAHPEWFPGMDMDVVRAQVTRWKHAGAPEGLWAAGMILRRHTEDIAAFNRIWWDEFQRGSTRDQLALPLARHFAGVRIEDIQGNIIGGDNDLMAFHWHAAWTNKGDNPQKAEELREFRERCPSASLPDLDPEAKIRRPLLAEVCHAGPTAERKAEAGSMREPQTAGLTL